MENILIYIKKEFSQLKAGAPEAVTIKIFINEIKESGYSHTRKQLGNAIYPFFIACTYSFNLSACSRLPGSW